MLSLLTPPEALTRIAFLMRQQRFNLNITQVHLAERPDVNLAILLKFERAGKISLESFIKIAFTLEMLDNILEALKQPDQAFRTLDELLITNHPKPPRKKASPHEK